MDQLKEDIGFVKKQTEKAIDNEINLLKVEIIDNASYYLASVFSKLLLLLLGAITAIFTLSAIAFLIYQYTQNLWISFGSIAGALLLLLTILLVFRKALIAGPMQDNIIGDIAPKLFKP